MPLVIPLLYAVNVKFIHIQFAILVAVAAPQDRTRVYDDSGYRYDRLRCPVEVPKSDLVRASRYTSDCRW